LAGGLEKVSLLAVKEVGKESDSQWMGKTLKDVAYGDCTECQRVG